MSRHSFDAVVQYFEQQSGIRLGPDKHALVQGRIQRLAHECGERDLDRFISHTLAGTDTNVLTQLVDRLTTNETYFFREPQHFQFLGGLLASPPAGGTFRVWSAASSSGEEAYSIAMVLADRLGLTRHWEVIGTDLSTEVVRKASQALYPITRADDIPEYYRHRHCLKGRGQHAEHMLIARPLRERTKFMTANLLEPLPDIGMFDVIFLRNMLIYFDTQTKRQIVQRVLKALKPGGYLLPGHSESLSNLELPIKAVRTAIYQHG